MKQPSAWERTNDASGCDLKQELSVMYTSTGNLCRKRDHNKARSINLYNKGKNNVRGGKDDLEFF